MSSLDARLKSKHLLPIFNNKVRVNVSVLFLALGKCSSVFQDTSDVEVGKKNKGTLYY